MSNKYTIVDGILLFNGEPANLEFGNIELKKFIESDYNRLKDYETGKIEVDIEVESKGYEASVEFSCKCSKKVYMSEEDEEEDDAIRYLLTRTRSCQCGITWGLEKDDDNDTGYSAIIK
jgi:hypothetical protein